MISRDEFDVNFDAIAAKVAESIGRDWATADTQVRSRIESTVRDAYTALEARVTEFGGMEKAAADAILGFGTPVEKPVRKTRATVPEPEPEPVEEKPKKRGK